MLSRKRCTKGVPFFCQNTIQKVGCRSLPFLISGVPLAPSPPPPLVFQIQLTCSNFMLRFHSFNNQSAFFSFSVQIFVGIEIKIMESFLGLISVRIVSPSFTYENNTSCISGYILSHRFLPLFLPGVKFQVFVILEASQFFFLRSCRQQESEKEQWTIDE